MTFLAGPAYACIFNIIPNEEKTPEQCDIFLKECGPRKIDVIKLLRSYKIPLSCFTSIKQYDKELTLSEAKVIVEKPLSLMYEDVYYAEAL